MNYVIVHSKKIIHTINNNVDPLGRLSFNNARMFSDSYLIIRTFSYLFCIHISIRSSLRMIAKKEKRNGIVKMFEWPIFSFMETLKNSHIDY